jgi:hypothetical protein
MRQGDPITRRYKIIYAPGDLIVRCLRHGGFAWHDREPGFVATKVEFPGLPHDARFVDAHYDYSRQSFGIIVSHPSWPEVPQGEMLPVIEQVGAARIMHSRLVEDDR